mgnify:CR=1 FL=1
MRRSSHPAADGDVHCVEDEFQKVRCRPFHRLPPDKVSGICHDPEMTLMRHHHLLSRQYGLHADLLGSSDA